MTLEEGIEWLKESARIEKETREKGTPLEYAIARGIRWGCFTMLCRLGYEDAALEAVRSVEEDESRGKRSSSSQS